MSKAHGQALRSAGFSDGQTVEIVAHVAFAVPVDCPSVAMRRAD